VGAVDVRQRAGREKASRRGEMPETVSLKEAIRQALDADDAREKDPATAVELMKLGRAERQRVLKEAADLAAESNEPVDMTFVEQAGQLIPWEGK